MSDYHATDPSLADHFKEMDRRHLSARSIEILERLLKDVDANYPKDYSSIDIDNIWRGNTHRLIQELRDDKHKSQVEALIDVINNEKPHPEAFFTKSEVIRLIRRLEQ